MTVIFSTRPEYSGITDRMDEIFAGLVLKCEPTTCEKNSAGDYHYYVRNLHPTDAQVAITIILKLVDVHSLILFR